MLNNKEKVDNYRKLLEEVRNLLEEDIDIDQLKKLSKEAVAMEETTDKELLKEFSNDHPLREVNIVVEGGEGEVNFLFSCGDSSELYDLKENKERALCQAIKSDDVELVKHLLIVLLPHDPKELRKINLNYLRELLSKAYEVSKDMKNYLEKKMRFYSFLCDFKSDNDPMELFVSRSEVDYEIDKFLLFFDYGKDRRRRAASRNRQYD